MQGTTNIVVGSGLLTDMAGVPARAILSGSALKAALYTPDSTRPELQTWDLDMDAGVVTLHFEETMDISDLAVDQITLQTSANAVDASTATVLSAGATATADEDGLSVFIYMTAQELDELKIKNIGRTAGAAWLVMTAAAIRDMAEQQVRFCFPSGFVFFPRRSIDHITCCRLSSVAHIPCFHAAGGTVGKRRQCDADATHDT